MDKLSEIMDPSSIFMMSEAEVASIAAETEESRTAREELRTKIKILKGGSETCKKIAAVYSNLSGNAVSDTDKTADHSGNKSPATDLMAETDIKEQYVSEVTPEATPEATSSKNQFLEEPVPEEEPIMLDDDEWNRPARSSKKKKKKASGWSSGWSNEPAPLPEVQPECAEEKAW